MRWKGVLVEDEGASQQGGTVVPPWRALELPRPESLELMSMVLRTQQLVAARLEPTLAAHDLNISRYLVLMALLAAREGAPMSTLRWVLLVHHTTVTQVVDKLTAQGYVERRPHPQDRRSVLAVLTDRGEAHARAVSAALAEQNYGVPELPARKRDRLVALLRELRELSGDLDDEDHPR